MELFRHVDLPICGLAIEASLEQPYLSFALDLDPVQLCDIITQTNLESDRQDNSMRGLSISNAEPSLIVLPNLASSLAIMPSRLSRLRHKL